MPKQYYDGEIAKSPRIQKLIDHLFEHMPVIEADRAETQRMMQELLELKAQMAKAGGEAPPKDEAPSDTTPVG